MGKIIAIANQKGGVGKTTTCVNLCCALKKRNYKVLAVDMDPQANLTSGLGVVKTAKPNSYDVLINGAAAADAVIHTDYCDLIPTNAALSGAAVELVEMEGREFVLKKALAELRGRYDYIFIDCPPSLEMLTLNALCAADSVLVTVQCEYYAMEGLADLMTSIRLTGENFNPALSVEGILLTMYDSRTNFSAQVSENIREYFGAQVYKTAIPRSVRIAESPSHGRPVITYDRMSKGSRAYLRLASEFINQNAKS